MIFFFCFLISVLSRGIPESAFDKRHDSFCELGGHSLCSNNAIRLELIILSLVEYENTTLRRKDSGFHYGKTLKPPQASICETCSELLSSVSEELTQIRIGHN